MAGGPQLKRMPQVLRRAVRRGAELAGQPSGRVDVLRRAAENEPLYMGLDVVFFDWEKQALYTEAGKRAMPGKAADTVNAYYEEIHARRPDADFSQQMSYIELRIACPSCC